MRKPYPWVQMLKWIFLDIGSTLCDECSFNKYLFTHILNSMEEAGLRISWDEFNAALKNVISNRRFTGYGYTGIVRELVKSFSNDPILLQKNMDYYRENAHKYVEMMEPVPEAIRVLNKLKEKYNLGVLANQPKGTRQKLESLGLARFFKLIVLSEEIGLKKPDIKVYQYTLNQVNCIPQEAAMVGDRIDADIGPAKSLGMRTVLIRRGIMLHMYPMNDFEVPDFEIKELDELLEIF